jgi:hypothetical protein
MTFTLDFDEARSLITINARGSADRNSRLESLRAVRMDSRFRNDYHILCNFPDENYVPEIAECVQLGLTIAAFFRGQKIALVVGATELDVLRGGIEKFNTGRLEINAYGDEASARDWLYSQIEAIAA